MVFILKGIGLETLEQAYSLRIYHVSYLGRCPRLLHFRGLQPLASI
jgi:hypothetical protein